MAVRDFKSTDDGEWYVENGDFVGVEDEEAVPQGIRIRVSMFLGECYLNEGIGIDYIDKILVKNPDPLLVRALISRAIANTPDVTNVIGAQLTEDAETRQASIEYLADTIYGTNSVSGQIGVP